LEDALDEAGRQALGALADGGLLARMGLEAADEPVMERLARAGDLLRERGAEAGGQLGFEAGGESVVEAGAAHPLEAGGERILEPAEKIVGELMSEARGETGLQRVVETGCQLRLEAAGRREDAGEAA